MRGRARGIAARRRLRELPQDDGLVPVLMSETTKTGKRHFIALRHPDEIRAHCEREMARHDLRIDHERWGGNQWGEQWVIQPELRDRFARERPLFRTDPTFPQWKAQIRASSIFPPPSRPTTGLSGAATR